MSKTLFESTKFDWDAMLKITKIHLELIPDPDMFIFFEKGTRGGISYVSNRYSKSNKTYLKSHDTQLEKTYIIYLGGINLYDYLMYNFLPQTDSNGQIPKSLT